MVDFELVRSNNANSFNITSTVTITDKTRDIRVKMFGTV